MAPVNQVANTYASGTAHGSGTNVVDDSLQGRLHNLPSDRLPRSVVGDIFSKAREESALMRLARQVPVGINETVVTLPDTFPEAGQVGAGTSLEDREGATKPVSGYKFGSQISFSPIKLAVIVTVSEEFARQNVDGLYSELTTQLPRAIARAADLAVFYNRDALAGAPLLGTGHNGSIVNGATRNVGGTPTTISPHEVELDLRRDASPDLIDQLIEGYNLVTADDYYDFTNFAAVPSMRAQLVTRRDSMGNPVFVPGAFPGSGAEISLNASMGSLLGVPVTFNKVVGGGVGNNAATDVKLIGGDFSQVVWGYADQIRFKVTDTATVGGVSMWQTNQIAVLCEASFGWYVNDPEAFVVYKDEVSDASSSSEA